ncbi:hypothetical protein NP233_g3177 [Leucocoprinus birnbaumii]|uniref:Uncharacterized protein n=1 Tax=Leucocoprinus birnbaumii TaxID=56174 RepID=A0AAD5YU65_9AGAR|nr:hypothetical protein NP233_g3177 [Leucocoprinus birnbaumii]
MHLQASVSIVAFVLPLAGLATSITPGQPVLRAIQPYRPAKRSATIKGLLQIRQTNDGCDIGFHSCGPTFCCRNDQNCDLGGCCPIGQTCIGTSDECTDPSLVLCPDKSVCCSPSDTCVTDSFGTTSCQTGGGGGGGTGNTSPTQQPTPTTRPVTTNVITPLQNTTIPGLGGLPSASSGSSGASPTAAAGQTMTTYAASDSSITYHGSWSTVSSSCTSNGRQTSTMKDSFTLMVPSASSIYLHLDRSAFVSYDVYINNNNNIATTPFNDDPETCTYNAITLPSTTSNVNLTVLVWGVLRNGRRQVDSWTYKINEILVAHPTGSGNGGSSTGSTGSSGSRGTGAGFKNVDLSVTLWLGLGAMLLANAVGLAL